MSQRNKAVGKSVGLFATCLVDLVRPEIGFSAASLLADAGFEVQVPKSQTCCGQPQFNSGDLAGTRKLARRFLKTFESFDYVVVPSGSCAATVKIHYPEVLADDLTHESQVADMAAKTYELTEFLTEVADCQIVAEYSASCTYHDSCSGYRELGIRTQPRMLLDQVEGLKMTECNESSACCGFGGTFCVKYPQISARIAAEKAENVERSGADTLLGGDLGCLMNIAGTLRRRGSQIQVRHVAEVLAGLGNAPAIGQPQK